MQNKKPRGFAALSPEQRREMSRSGGKAAQQKGTGHKWDREEARRQGSKGGKKRKWKKRELIDPTLEEK